ncbi:MAG: PilZ domain-containing protein [Acidobacteria bacterium]|nr:PilZ domain-containing protein [Acidobacteriota bacterium]
MPVEPRVERGEDRVTTVVEITLDSAAGSRPTRISDLSMGGCFIESITNYRPGEIISFDLKTISGEEIRFTGKVAYVLAGFGFGLKFNNLTSSHALFLRKTIELSAQ